jgi:hypothetical protein
MVITTTATKEWARELAGQVKAEDGGGQMMQP